MGYTVKAGDIFFKKNGSSVVKNGQRLSPLTFKNANVTHAGIVISGDSKGGFSDGNAMTVAEVTRESGFVISSWVLQNDKWYSRVDDFFPDKASKYEICISKNEIVILNDNTYYLFQDVSSNILLKYKDETKEEIKLTFNKDTFKFLYPLTSGMCTKENIDLLFKVIPVGDQSIVIKNANDRFVGVFDLVIPMLFKGIEEFLRWKDTGVKREDLVFFRNNQDPNIHKELAEIANAARGHILAKKITVDHLDDKQNFIKCFISKEPVNKQKMLIIEYYSGYDLFLMKELPVNDSERAEEGKLYLLDNGDYIVRDPSGKIQKGSLNGEGIDLTNLGDRLKNITLKKAILDVISKRGHARHSNITLFYCASNGAVSEKEITKEQYNQFYAEIFEASGEDRIVAVVNPFKIDSSIGYSDTFAALSATLVIGKILLGLDKLNSKDYEKEVNKLLEEFTNDTFCSGFVAKCLGIHSLLSNMEKDVLRPGATNPAKLLLYLQDMRWEKFVVTQEDVAPDPGKQNQERCVLS